MPRASGHMSPANKPSSQTGSIETAIELEAEHPSVSDAAFPAPPPHGPKSEHRKECRLNLSLQTEPMLRGNDVVEHDAPHITAGNHLHRVGRLADGRNGVCRRWYGPNVRSFQHRIPAHRRTRHGRLRKLPPQRPVQGHAAKMLKLPQWIAGSGQTSTTPCHHRVVRVLPQRR